MNDKEIIELQNFADKNSRLFVFMNQWTRLLQDGKAVADYFRRNNYKKIAIYGFGLVGETLERELRETEIEVAYIIDQNAEYMYAPTNIILPQDIYDDVEILVVTSFEKANELVEYLQARSKGKVIFIGDILKEL